MNIDSDYKYLFKLVLIGDSGVGKSSLVYRYCDGDFLGNNQPTIGVDFRIRNINVNYDNRRIPVKLQIWDTAGQERFKSIVKQYYRHADVMIIVYDCSDMGSFQNCSQWFAEVGLLAKDNVIKFLIANKCDIKSDSDDRQVTKEEGEYMAKQFEAYYLETSALDGENVDEMFLKSAQVLTERAEKCMSPNDNINHHTGITSNTVAVSPNSQTKSSTSMFNCCYG